ncbi:PiggyBac transposable element-derived protein 2 [Araneus ventricosus]|uniref:PiggyBac transposable element-derived protein 2 n=1 Tax=Araneus ventricosus TaxID=182803 RepID=A0A4Y2MBZ5_ARAVE|nr:PiggyBac transposable element-derived protein 2 [Araneus ventricosus]
MTECALIDWDRLEQRTSLEFYPLCELKSWYIVWSDGYLFHAEPYSGSTTKLPQTGLDQGPDVVLGLMNKVHAREGNHVVMDKLFTSIPLLNELSKKGIAGTGTIRENRLENAPLPPKKSMKKTSRGTFEYACSENLVIVKWNDNTAVSVATSKVKASSCVMTERWSSAQEKKIQVSMPQPLKTYNVHMGGGIGAALVNGWRLYRALGHDISLLQFTHECSQEVLGKFGMPSIGHGRSLVLQKNAFNQQRYDRKDHWLYKSDKQFGRCKNCGRRSIYRCEKCQVPLHPECHKTYHIVS